MAQLFLNSDFDYEFIPGGVRLTRYLGSEANVIVPSEYPAGSGNKVLELENTFAGNTTVASVTVLMGVCALSGGIFAGCSALRHVFLPESIVFVSPSAFDGCGGVTVECCSAVARKLDLSAFSAVSDIQINEYGYSIGDMYTSGYGDSYDCSYDGFDFGSDASKEIEVSPDYSARNDDLPVSPTIPEPDMMFPGMDADFDCPPPPMPDIQYSHAAPAPMPPAPAPSPSFSGRLQASKRESVKVTPVRCDKVSFSALSPEKVERGEYSTVSVYMYTKSQRKIVDKAIKAAKSAVAETSKGGFTVDRGTDVTIELCSDDVTVKDNRITMAWYGSALDVDFMFFTPEDYSKKQIGFTCYIYFNGIQITRLNFTVSLRGDSKRVPVKVRRHDNRHVFVSYAHKDTQRVLAQLLDIQELAPKMTFWLDSQSLDTGDNWRSEIKRAINKADGLFLFWSVYSKASAEVEKEWKYALKRKGLNFITPVPLDPPEMCPPPAELGSRHFGHRSFNYSEDMEKLNFRNSKRVKIIR